MTEYYPESTYFVDSTLTRASLKKGDIVTGKVEILVREHEYLVINLGQFRAHMSFEECSIYKLRSSFGYVDPNIYALVGKTIRAKVIEVDSSLKISRKAFMVEALDYFKAVNPSKFTVAITGFNKLSTFVDIGAGIHGRIVPQEFTNVYFNNVQDIGLSIGDFFIAENLGYNESIKAFDLSRRIVIENEPIHLEKDYLVDFKVFEPLPDGNGYVGLISGKYKGLLDSKVKLNYGDEVIAIVKDISEKGIKMKFVSFYTP